MPLNFVRREKLVKVSFIVAISVSLEPELPPTPIIVRPKPVVNFLGDQWEVESYFRT